MTQRERQWEAVTQERLRELLDYNPHTGLFTHKLSRSNRHKGDIAGSLNVYGYVQMTVDRKVYLAHRLAWLYVNGRWPDGPLDHKNNIRTHNWIANLRLASPTQNQANARVQRNSLSQLKGVGFNPANKKWRAKIRANGKQFHLGYFATAEEAHAAYCCAASELFGEFARTA